METPRYQFAEFTLDCERGALYTDGAEVKLRPRSFDVLRYLLEHPGKLVSRDELMDALWSGAVVTEDAVTHCLIDIRKAIGHSDQTMIRTGPRNGYVFELPVEVIDREVSEDPSAVAGANRRRLVTAGVLIIAAIPWVGYGAYLLPLRRRSTELAFVLANHTWLSRTGQTYEEFLSNARSPVRRLGRWLVPLPEARTERSVH